MTILDAAENQDVVRGGVTKPRRDRAKELCTQHCEVCLASTAVKSGVARVGLIDERR